MSSPLDNLDSPPPMQMEIVPLLKRQANEQGKFRSGVNSAGTAGWVRGFVATLVCLTGVVGFKIDARNPGNRSLTFLVSESRSRELDRFWTVGMDCVSSWQLSETYTQIPAGPFCGGRIVSVRNVRSGRPMRISWLQRCGRSLHADGNGSHFSVGSVSPSY